MRDRPRGAARASGCSSANWSPPEPKLATSHRIVDGSSPVARSAIPRWWREIPAWAQVAAALLFLGVSAGIANLDVRYDQNGLSIRTGWSASRARPAQSGATAGVGRTASRRARRSSRRSRRAVACRTSRALERQLQDRDSRVAGAAHGAHGGRPGARTAADAETLRRVRALVDESEKRQQRELALRVAEVAARRQRAAAGGSGARSIARSASVQNNVGVEVHEDTGSR